MNPYPDQDRPLTEDEMLLAPSPHDAVTKYRLMLVLLANFNDYQGGLWSDYEVATRPNGNAYRADAAFRHAVAGPCHSVFGAECYVCGMSASDARRSGTKLTTAHIVYPAMPFSEVVDRDLTRSDVVLLCWHCHTAFDALTGGMYESITDLRVHSVNVLNRMRSDSFRRG